MKLRPLFMANKKQFFHHRSTFGWTRIEFGSSTFPKWSICQLRISGGIELPPDRHLSTLPPTAVIPASCHPVHPLLPEYANIEICYNMQIFVDKANLGRYMQIKYMCWQSKHIQIFGEKVNICKYLCTVVKFVYMSM